MPTGVATYSRAGSHHPRWADINGLSHPRNYHNRCYYHYPLALYVELYFLLADALRKERVHRASPTLPSEFDHA